MQKHNKGAGKGSLFPPARPWGGQKIYYHSIQPESGWIGLVVKLFQTSKSSSSSSCASSSSLSLSPSSSSGRVARSLTELRTPVAIPLGVARGGG